jgi:dTDP-4-amino-4,6-dideoxygalactose transaminase
LHSDISVFSLHPVKAITSGEGGVITTKSKLIGNKLRLLRSHGMMRNKKEYWKYDILSPTLNFRMSDVNAALGFSQLKKLPKFIKKRKEIANLYFENLDNFKNVIKISKVDKNIISAYHLLIINFDFKKLSISKNDLIKKLNKKNIFPQYHYIPIYKYTFYKNLNSPGKFRNSENYYKSALSFPIYYKLEKKNLMKVFKCVKEILIRHLN